MTPSFSLTPTAPSPIGTREPATLTVGKKSRRLVKMLHALLRTDLSGDAQNLEASVRKQSHWKGELKQVHRDGERIVPQTILLVEDEEMLRDLGVTNLESEGYRVLAARDGMEAVALFEAHRDEIGLVVCDLGLPRLGGREVFLKMKQSRPGVRAIVASGYLEPSIRSEMLKAGVIDTIQKPYDFNDLLAKIRSIIAPPPVADDHPELF